MTRKQQQRPRQQHRQQSQLQGQRRPGLRRNGSMLTSQFALSLLLLQLLILQLITTASSLLIMPNIADHSFGTLKLTYNKNIIINNNYKDSSNNAKATASSSSTCLKAALSSECEGSSSSSCKSSSTKSRREMLSKASSTVATFALFLTATTPSVAVAAADDVKEMRALIEKAKSQLEVVPQLVKDEKWDAVRGVLTEAPLRDCWSKTTPILKKYADALGETPTGDELAALEGREDLLGHLRFLDMAVYNNIFNPIATEGKSGASKALIDSYYNDPVREYEASKRTLEDLIELSN